MSKTLPEGGMNTTEAASPRLTYALSLNPLEIMWAPWSTVISYHHYFLDETTAHLTANNLPHIPGIKSQV